MRKFIEAVLDFDRIVKGGGGNIRIRSPKGEGNGPRSGCFWLRGTELIPVEGSSNEIVNHAGQAVLLDPETYGLTSEEIMSWLGPVNNPRSPSREYFTFLNNNGNFKDGTKFDPSKHALLWQSSKIVFEKMLKLGWSWIIYDPPSMIHFTVTPDHAKITLHTAAEYFPLLQITDIKVTLVTDFSFVNSKFPHMSSNKTLSFSNKDGGFGKNFNAVIDWTSGKDAPESNYLYLLVNKDRKPDNISSMKITLNFKNKSFKRWGLRCLITPPKDIPEGQVLIRFPRSIKYSIGVGADIASKPKKNLSILFSSQYFIIPYKNIEVLQDGKWKNFNYISEVALPKTVRDAYAILHAAGYRQIGQGNYSRVYAKPNDTSVLKLFAPNDIAFKAFVGFTKSHPSPHFPKFSRKVMNVGQYCAIRTERLEPFEGNYDNILTYIMSNYYKLTGENYSVPAYYLEDANDYMERQPSLKKAADEIIRFALRNKFQPDCKRKNLMLRGDTIVFIDPVCGGPKTDDRGLAHVTKID